ncbi:hypothetical protein [Hyphobacterium marinum]|uniref:Uncharacterized protein n=1 Tax=Hyphobacterium marinum TaxID=3116574 RepID=A0ABU7LWX5_9PROT|nr:hypothetical protein [Hyphobacterium sp. Y6023]MEE2565981.1 hypothetical protein [Hyphobacterium sp. Y6023]
MNALYPTALAGMVAAQNRVIGAARAVANPGVDAADMARSAVEMKSAKAAHAAAASVARTAADMEDRLLDILV